MLYTLEKEQYFLVFNKNSDTTYFAMFRKGKAYLVDSTSLHPHQLFSSLYRQTETQNQSKKKDLRSR